MSTTLYVSRKTSLGRHRTSRVPLPTRKPTPALAEAIRRQQTRQRAHRLSDDASRWATWAKGEHRSRERHRDVGLRVMLSLCLAMALVLLALGVRMPPADMRHVGALMMSGALFAMFVIGMVDRR